MNLSEQENLNIRVVVTMRADFVESCLAHEDLTRSIQADAVYLGPMTGEALEAAIEQPVIVQGAMLQPKLLAQIVQDVEAEENCLPLLEFALSQLWERPLTPNSGGTGPDFGFKATGTEGLSIRELTLTDYRKLGGVVGALNAHAEGIYKQLAVQKREVWVQRVMLKLVRTGEETKDTRQRQRRNDLLGIAKDDAERETIESVIQSLVDGRLLVSDRIDNQDVIDLSHEALMRSWKRFVEWRGNDRDVRRIVDAIEDAKRKWIEQGKKRRDLLEGRLLKDGRRSLKEAPAEVFGAKGFIRKSLWVRRSEFASWMVIPIVILGIPAEYFWREEVIRQDYDRIERISNGDPAETFAVLNLVQGCWSKKQYEEIPSYFKERAFGNCRSLSNAKLDGLNLSDVNLSGADLHGSNLSGAQLRNVNLSGAELYRANLTRVTIHGVVSNVPGLTDAVLSKINLGGANLRESNLQSINLSSANLMQADLSSATLNDVNLSGANLVYANLNKANLIHANLSWAMLQGVNFEEVKFSCDTTIADIPIMCPIFTHIKWSKDTNWQNIQGWETVENVPPALKQQLGLK